MAEEVVTSESVVDAAPAWPLRPWLLAGLLSFAGLLIHFVTHEHDDVAWRVAVAAFLFFASLGAAFTLERGRWQGSAVFALVIGLVIAGLAWRAVNYGQYLADEQYGFASGVVATALALPLFQAGFLRRRFATPYAEIYPTSGPTRSAPPGRWRSPASRGSRWRSSRSCSFCSSSTFSAT